MAWEVRKLGDVSKIMYGYTESASINEIGPKFLRITDIQDSDVNWETVPYCKINESDFKKHKLSDGDIVFARTGATTGKSYLLVNPPDSVAASYLIKVHLENSKLKPEFLYQYFQSGEYWDLIKIGKTGSTLGGFNATKLSELEIPIPPLAEQKRIVEILDEAFSAISTAKENAEKNLKNAKELFESYLNNIFEKIGKDWEEKKLGEVCEIKPSKSEAREKLKDTDSVSFVPMEDMGINQKYFIPEKERTLKEVEGSYTYFANGDVLLAKITPCFENGKLGIAKNLKNSIGFGSSEYIVFRTNRSLFTEYLYYFLSRSSFRTEGAQRMMGAVGHKRVSKEFIENTRIPFPPLKEQQRIVAKLDAISEQTKKLEAVYVKKIADLDELKKSILQKAFKGEL